jgi:hypothetical protein
VTNGTDQDPLLDLFDAQDLAFDALKIARKGLVRNPRKEEKRRLERIVARLEEELKHIGDQIDALADEDDAYQGPSAEEMKLVQDVSEDLDGLTNANVTARNAMVLASRALEVIGKIADA